MVVVTTLVASTLSHHGPPRPGLRGDLAQQSLLAKRNARDADNARDRLETLLRAATGSAIMGVDPSGTVTFFSAGAEQMLGYTAAEVVGIRSIADFIDPAQIDERRQTIDAMRTAMDRGRPRGGGRSSLDGHRARTASNAAAWSGYAHALARCCGQEATEGRRPDASGPAAGYVVVAIDVTEREELAAERERLYSVQNEVTQSLIEQNNRLRELTQMKDDVVATVSHELRTPITSIRGFIELLLDGGARAERGPDPDAAAPSTATRPSCNGWPRTCLADPGGGHGLRVAFSELDLRQLAEESVHACQTAATTAGVKVTLEARPRCARSSVTRPGCTSCWATCCPTPSSSRPGAGGSGGGRHGRRLRPGPGHGRGPRASPRPSGPSSSSASTAWPPPWRWACPAPGSALAIAKSVAEAHDGFVDIVDTPGWSTTFRVFLPLRTTASSTQSA